MLPFGIKNLNFRGFREMRNGVWGATCRDEAVKKWEKLKQPGTGRERCGATRAALHVVFPLARIDQALGGLTVPNCTVGAFCIKPNLLLPLGGYACRYRLLLLTILNGIFYQFKIFEFERLLKFFRYRIQYFTIYLIFLMNFGSKFVHHQKSLNFCKKFEYFTKIKTFGWKHELKNFS